MHIYSIAGPSVVYIGHITPVDNFRMAKVVAVNSSSVLTLEYDRDNDAEQKYRTFDLSVPDFPKELFSKRIEDKDIPFYKVKSYAFDSSIVKIRIRPFHVDGSEMSIYYNYSMAGGYFNSYKLPEISRINHISRMTSIRTDIIDFWITGELIFLLPIYGLAPYCKDYFLTTMVEEMRSYIRHLKQMTD